MTAPNWLSWIENTQSRPGSPESMALTTQSTSSDVRFVRALPQTKRVPVGWWSMPAPTVSKKYAVMRVHFTCSPSPRSVYSRWPQVGEPPLHPPATPKFALAPLGRMMKPPPVRKSHADWALAEPPASTSVATPTRDATASRGVTLRIFFSSTCLHTIRLIFLGEAWLEAFRRSAAFSALISRRLAPPWLPRRWHRPSPTRPPRRPRRR